METGDVILKKKAPLPIETIAIHQNPLNEFACNFNI